LATIACKGNASAPFITIRFAFLPTLFVTLLHGITLWWRHRFHLYPR